MVVLEVTSCRLTVTAATRTYGLSRQHIYRLLKRFQLGGLDAVDPRSGHPTSNPRAVRDDVIAAIVLLREQLTADGLDAGPLILQEHLPKQGLPAPATSTIHRIQHHHGLITPQPRKRSKSSYRRFAADQPRRMLAIRLHPLAPRRQHQHRNPQLARRPLPLRPALHRIPQSHRQ
ncbi:helix-turn-helix domain-containing protein [Mycobacterium sp. 155]|uniref:helix-turn-helix domain-containing protein n=1 Tax=Mycobacterium sp. 155 TaxID=1157943 RepID=UPI00039ADF22|nr:helix-turn-helix domain-containing protein [Mycobacterium sp. 155]